MNCREKFNVLNSDIQQISYMIYAGYMIFISLVSAIDKTVTTYKIFLKSILIRKSIYLDTQM